MINGETIAQLKSLNDRLQSAGFSWQHSDYFLLTEILPAILLILNAKNKLPREMDTILRSHEELVEACKAIIPFCLFLDTSLSPDQGIEMKKAWHKLQQAITNATK